MIHPDLDVYPKSLYNEIMEQILIIMQGASGSGKSTRAKELAQQYNAVVFGSDEFFIVDGVYKFNPKMLGLYHKKNQERTKLALQEGKSVIVDNTNTQKWEAKPYVQAAVELGVKVMFVRCDGQYKNIHGVPDEKVLQMRNRLEELTVEECLNAKSPF
jgi:predicted kinase